MTISPGRRAVEYHARSCYSKAELVVDPSADSRRPARGHAEDAEMKARFPKFDFSNIREHWTPNKELAQRANAASLIQAYIEHYPLKVMVTAKPLIYPSTTQVIEDHNILIKTEIN